MHFEEVMELDMEKVLENTKVTAKRRYTEQELRGLLLGYTKSKYPIESLMGRVDIAIKNEKFFCEDEEELEHKIGSRIGLLMTELRQQ